jgi:hypothetical protein
MSDVQQQNPDGSWSNATPLEYQGDALDAEIYELGEGRVKANVYDKDVLVTIIFAKNRKKLAKKLSKFAKTSGRVVDMFG